MVYMTAEVRARVPEWTKGDRMRKSMESAEISAIAMAEYLGVARNTVSTWLHDRINPSRQTVLLWALRTGVPVEWLETGQAPALPPGPDGCAARDSNPEPASWFHRLVKAMIGSHSMAARADLAPVVDLVSRERVA